MAKAGLDAQRQANFWDLLCREDVTELLQWIWVLEDEEMQGMIKGGILHIPKANSNFEPKVALSLSGDKTPERNQHSCELDFNMATYNAMSLKSSNQKHGDGPGRLRILFRKSCEQGVHFIALQETRIQREHLLKDPDYFYINSTADLKGNGGTLFAWCKSLPYAKDDSGTDRFLEEHDVSLIYKDEQTMIVKIENEFLKFLVMSIHGPHTGYEDDQIESYWDTLPALIPQRWCDWPIVFLGDTNARMGQCTSDAVGGYGAEQGTKASDCFANFLKKFSMWLPSTFEGVHQGEHHTWYHPGGCGSRIDFCAIPLSWALWKIDSQVNRNLSVHDSVEGP